MWRISIRGVVRHLPGSHLRSAVARGIEQPLGVKRSLSAARRTFSFITDIVSLDKSDVNRTREILHNTPIGSISSRTERKEVIQLIDRWAKLYSAEGVEQSFALLDRLVREPQSEDDDDWGTDCLHNVIDGWFKCSDDFSAFAPSRVLDKLSTYQTDKLFPNVAIYAMIVAPSMVLDKLSTYQEQRLLPNVAIYCMIVDKIVERDNPKQTPQIIDNIFQRIAFAAESNPKVRPTAAIYDAAIKALTKCGLSDGPERAEQYLLEMVDEYKKGRMDGIPNISSWVTVLSAYAHSRNEEAPQQAEALLQRMQGCDIPGIVPHNIAYGAVIDAWAKSSDPGAPDRALSILRHMEKLYEASNEDLKPTVISYEATIAALARAGRAPEAEELLLELLDRYESTRDEDFRPHTVQFNSVLNAWSRSGQKGAALRAEELLDLVNQLAMSTNNDDLLPDTVSFNTVMNAWAKSKEAAAPERCEKILETMETLHKSGNQLIRPTTISYNTVIDCWAESGHPEAPDRASTLLGDLEDAYNDTRDTKLRPTHTSFNNVIKAWAESDRPDAMQVATAICRWMQTKHNLEPDRVTLNIMLFGWAGSSKRGDPTAAEEADALFSEVTKVDVSGVVACKPDRVTFNSLLNAWSFSKNKSAVPRSLQLLETMKNSEQEGIQDVSPNAQTFGAILRTLSKHHSVEGVASAKALLNEADQHSVKLLEFNYLPILWICCYVKGKEPGKPLPEEAFELAKLVFERVVRTFKTPEPRIYASFIEACAFNDTDLLAKVYSMCVKEGHRDDPRVQRAIKKYAPHLATRNHSS